MEEWVMSQLYEELLSMRLWTLSAFGDLKKDDVLASDSVQYQLLTYLVLQWMNNCPRRFYDGDTRHDWNASTYVPVVRQAVITLKLKKERIEEKSKKIRILEGEAGEIESEKLA